MNPNETDLQRRIEPPHDPPACENCGHITVWKDGRFKCLNCGHEFTPNSGEA